MFSFHSFKSAVRGRSLQQIVADAYTRLWDCFWLPIRLFAKLLLQTKLYRPRWTPWLFGALLGRWPQRINDITRFAETLNVKPVAHCNQVNWTLMMKDRLHMIHLTFSLR